MRRLALAFALLVMAGIAVSLGLLAVQPARPEAVGIKADKLPVQALVARPVRVIHLAGDPPPAIRLPPPAPPRERDLLEANQPADTLPAPAPRLHRRDPCARYGGHRVVTGRYWHCRYG
jgi:poly(3-hydroxybutyrate) depolymerase